MENRRPKRQTKIVTFSGIDGAGKSTQIESLRLGLQDAGLHVKLVTFWEDIARLKGIREGAGHSLFGGDRGVGSPSAPINRRDKNVRSGLMTAVRLVLYLIDAISTRLAAKRAVREDPGVVIFDRYIYDELANLSLNNRFIRAYARLILMLVPKPDISYLLDADPSQARARKPEYPLDFLVINRQSYLDLSKIVDRMSVVPALSIDEVKRIILQNAFRVFQIEGIRESSREEEAVLIKKNQRAERDEPYTRCRRATKMLGNLDKKHCCFIALLLLQAAVYLPAAYGTSCTTQSQMSGSQRDALSSAARTMLIQMENGDVQALHANTDPAVAADFGGIATSIENLKPFIQKATFTVDNVYILDASTEPAGTSRIEFFCGEPVVTLNFSDIPPGTYALAIGHATGVSQPQQISLILSKGAQDKWMFAGLFSKPMMLVGHDGLWYWTSARKYATQNMNWDAWFYYKIATYLLNPIDLLSSSNLEKVQHETDKVKPAALPGSSPVSLAARGGTYSVTTIDTTTTFGALDLDVHYNPDPTQTSQLRDPPTARKQVVDVMSALLEQHPELHQAFHGIWVHADQGAATLFALELPMDGISGPSINSQPATH